jgi:CrcB protein
MVFAFGGLGALARVALLGLFPVRSALLGTLLVNALGCLAIGVLFEWFETRDLLSAEARTGLVAGLLGGFTTFSAFGLELLELLESGRLLAGLGYAAASVLRLLTPSGSARATRQLGIAGNERPFFRTRCARSKGHEDRGSPVLRRRRRALRSLAPPGRGTPRPWQAVRRPAEASSSERDDSCGSPGSPKSGAGAGPPVPGRAVARGRTGSVNNGLRHHI